MAMRAVFRKRFCGLHGGLQCAVEEAATTGPAPGPKYLCHIGNHQCVQDPTGDFNSSAACAAKCSPAPPKFICHLTTSTCVQDPAGDFNSSAACSAKCGQSPVEA